MRRLVRMVAAGAGLGVAAACASAWPAQRYEIVAGSVSSDSALEGGFRWTSLDRKTAPAEFPANSGTRIVYGTLDLRDVKAARAGAGDGGSYSMRFTTQPANDTARTTGNDGRFIIRGDSLFFSPVGQMSRVVFRFAWQPTGELALTDGENHVWAYARR